MKVAGCKENHVKFFHLRHPSSLASFEVIFWIGPISRGLYLRYVLCSVVEHQGALTKTPANLDITCKPCENYVTFGPLA
eukprot:m.224511 g.224511  ORF g.224511 m.224511 type:complete len:79 (-) comp15951_c0_seq3:2563-2799(-)